MKIRNLKKAATLLRSLGYTKRRPLVIPPTSLTVFYDTRHYADESWYGPFTALWQKWGCVWGRREDGTEERLQCTETFDKRTNYWELESFIEEEIVAVIQGETHYFIRGDGVTMKVPVGCAEDLPF